RAIPVVRMRRLHPGGFPVVRSTRTTVRRPGYRPERLTDRLGAAFPFTQPIRQLPVSLEEDPHLLVVLPQLLVVLPRIPLQLLGELPVRLLHLPEPLGELLDGWGRRGRCGCGRRRRRGASALRPDLAAGDGHQATQDEDSDPRSTFRSGQHANTDSRESCSQTFCILETRPLRAPSPSPHLSRPAPPPPPS